MGIFFRKKKIHSSGGLDLGVNAASAGVGMKNDIDATLAPGQQINSDGPHRPVTTSSLSTTGLGGGLIMAGLHYVFLPDTSIKSILTRSSWSAAFACLGHLLTPSALRDTHMDGITLEATALAAGASALIASGYALLLHPYNHNKRFYKRCLGGVMVNLGFYIWSPSYIRIIWQYENSYLGTTGITPAATGGNLLKGVVLGSVIECVLRILYKGYSKGSSMILDAVKDKTEIPVKGEKENETAKETAVAVVVDGEEDDGILPPILRRPLGGGLLMLGVYLWLPPAMRGYMDLSSKVKRIIKILQFLTSLRG